MHDDGINVAVMMMMMTWAMIDHEGFLKVMMIRWCIVFHDTCSHQPLTPPTHTHTHKHTVGLHLFHSLTLLIQFSPPSPHKFFHFFTRHSPGSTIQQLSNSLARTQGFEKTIPKEIHGTFLAFSVTLVSKMIS